MKIFLDVIPHTLSRAMHRVALALRRSSPYEVVDSRGNADIEIVHATGVRDLAEYIDEIKHAGRRVVMLQYCFQTGGTVDEWRSIWERVDLVWSYLPTLKPHLGDLLFLYPLGVAPELMTQSVDDLLRSQRSGVLTSGYVAHRDGEAIGEVARAASMRNLPVIHLGPPNPVGLLNKATDWRSMLNVSDKDLARVYGSLQAVSGLRFFEGFELPAAEGLVNGARPIMFERSDASIWFSDMAAYVPEFESGSRQLVDAIADAFDSMKPVTRDEIERARQHFDWRVICADFWKRVARI